MPARGTVSIGDKAYAFEPNDSFGVLDWVADTGFTAIDGTGARRLDFTRANRLGGTLVTALRTALPPRKM